MCFSPKIYQNLRKSTSECFIMSNCINSANIGKNFRKFQGCFYQKAIDMLLQGIAQLVAVR